MRVKVRKIETPKPTATDENRLRPEAFEVARLDLAPKLNGNVNFAVKTVADFVAPRKLGEVTADEIRASLDAIVAKTKAGDAGDNDRLPLSGEAQDEWVRKNASRWYKKFSVEDVRERFSAEIRGGETITPEMLDTLATEKAAEEAQKRELVGERPDPKSETVSCVFELHKDGKPREFQPTTKFRITRGTNGWERQRHPQGDDLIRVGNFYVPPTADSEEPRADAYCHDCRELAWKMGRETNTKLTFHDREGADRKIAAITKARQKVGAAANQLGLGARRQGSQMPKAMRTNWKTTGRRGSR